MRVAVRVMVDVLAGLHAAHELADDDGKPLGIVHRDVSPQNILIGVDGSARLTDFGVARATSKLSTTRTGQLKGKLAYMAPEQARGAKDIDRRADVFAAGVVLWEALEGRRLFKGDGEADTLNKVLYEPIPPLRGRGADRSRPRSRSLSTRRSSASACGATRPPRRSPTRSSERRAMPATSRRTRTWPRTSTRSSGVEIVNQRETVRAWIARGEPSRPKSLSMPPPVPTGADAAASRAEAPVAGVDAFERGERRVGRDLQPRPAGRPRRRSRERPSVPPAGAAVRAGSGSSRPARWSRATVGADPLVGGPRRGACSGAWRAARLRARRRSPSRRPPPLAAELGVSPRRAARRRRRRPTPASGADAAADRHVAPAPRRRTRRLPEAPPSSAPLAVAPPTPPCRTTSRETRIVSRCRALAIARGLAVLRGAAAGRRAPALRRGTAAGGRARAALHGGAQRARRDGARAGRRRSSRACSARDRRRA